MMYFWIAFGSMGAGLLGGAISAWDDKYARRTGQTMKEGGGRGY